MERRQANNLSPALAASAVLHLGLAVLAWLSWQTAKKIEITPVVPVQIVTGSPGLEETVKAEEAASAQSPTEEPAPEPEPTPPAPPPPQPRPTPPPPQPKPQPAPAKPAPPRPTPPKPAPAKPAPPKPQPAAKPKPAEPEFDFDKLARTVAQATPRNPGRPAPAATRGPARPATGPVAQHGTGSTALSGAELGALKSKLERLWNPNCTVPGASSVVVKVRIRLSPDGRLTGRPDVVGRSGSASAEVLENAADRAVSAVGRGAPYDELPADKYEGWKDIVLNFNGKSACSR